VDGPTEVWKGVVELPPGPCTIQLRARNADGEVICTASELVTIASDALPEIYVDMVCYGTCPTITLPGSTASPKLSCGPVSGVLLSAETPAELEPVQSIRYKMTPIEDIFLASDPPFGIYEGSLSMTGAGTTDFGGGPVATETWEATVGVVDAISPYTLELTAIGVDEEPVCSVETTVDLIENGLTQVHVAMPCSD